VRTLYTACKHRGFVTVTYFDLRAAMAARAQLHGTSLGPHTLEILFSLPKQALEDSCLNQVSSQPGQACCRELMQQPCAVAVRLWLLSSHVYCALRQQTLAPALPLPPQHPHLH
jgi:hypothetical protein